MSEDSHTSPELRRHEIPAAGRGFRPPLGPPLIELRQLSDYQLQNALRVIKEGGLARTGLLWAQIRNPELTSGAWGLWEADEQQTRIALARVDHVVDEIIAARPDAAIHPSRRDATFSTFSSRVSDRRQAASSTSAGRRRHAGRGDTGESVESSVVRIYRCAKVVKGGRTFSFGALVVAGDRHGNVGIGYGKANEVPQAVEKATKDARKAMIKVSLKGTTIPHIVRGRVGASSVVLVPARPGTGVTAGKSVRPVLELAGITDVLTKAHGSTTPKNLVKATLSALKQLQTRAQVEAARSVRLSEQQVA